MIMVCHKVVINIIVNPFNRRNQVYMYKWDISSIETVIVLMFTLGLSIYTTEGVTQICSQTLGSSLIEICDLICVLYSGTITSLVYWMLGVHVHNTCNLIRAHNSF